MPPKTKTLISPSEVEPTSPAPDDPLAALQALSREPAEKAEATAEALWAELRALHNRIVPEVLVQLRAFRDTHAARLNAMRGLDYHALRAAVRAVQARFQAAYPPADPTWRDDALENPAAGEHRAPYLLRSPRPAEGPWPIADQRAASNTLDAIAGGRTALAQQALDYIEDGPADRLPDVPRDYTPFEPSQAIATLKRGWGERYEDNLRLARAVVDAYEAKKGGGIREYLDRTGLGNDPRLIRLAARTGRQWIKQGWRP